jgi:hypothetical protein
MTTATLPPFTDRAAFIAWYHQTLKTAVVNGYQWALPLLAEAEDTYPAWTAEAEALLEGGPASVRLP